ncbi:egalitarian protein homolog isoform X2 [Bradysia coprophila]|uniref:egalitarian protein homolog isoform X2 n=1 Tax=Bradysia coprophila TaxID=38358 RepID=UPI00187D9566|nr:egalitarian protein homolog isoform X2 [Bradysia coprophila]
MDWDFAKTKTLLYYYEYLMRKGEPQKIAHLACLFGEPDFTGDMRTIVGRTLTGLKTLLSEHPYLFKIVNGELVYLSANETPTSEVLVDRDCNEETREFFKHKLLTYGVGIEVPLKSLLGHRSQAPPRIRHTCGAHAAEFKRFLSQYPETFRIIDKNVLLLEFDDLKSLRSTPSGLPFVGHRQNSGNHNAAYEDDLLKFENLCKHNCPKMCDITNGYSPIQLHVGGISNVLQVRKNTLIISTVADSLRVTSEILKLVADNGDQALVSFNCKGSRAGVYTEMTLLELGTPNGQTFLFDVLTCPRIMTDGGVKELLVSDRIVKVMHNCRYKSGYLYQQFKIILKCVFDTQLAYAVLQYQKNGSNVRNAKVMLFHQLIQLYCPYNAVGEQFVSYMWSARERPFTEDMVGYAARRAQNLLKLYGSMALLIEERNKPLLSDLCTEEILSWIHPQEVKAQQQENNVTSDAITSNGKQSQTTTKKAQLRSAASELVHNSRDNVSQQGSTCRRCCDCNTDKESQTLSTGHIVMLSKTYEN